MKYTFWGFGLIMAGIFGLVFIVMFESITVNNESEYYILKEAMEASMLESVDLACFRNSNTDVGACNGSLKISEQKFVENFTRRFVASVSGDASQYKLDFYDIIESPPKATVIVTGVTQEYFIFNTRRKDQFNITNNLTGILESKDWKYILDNNINESYSNVEDDIDDDILYHEGMTVSDLAEALGVSGNEVIDKLRSHDSDMSLDQAIDFDIASVICREYGKLLTEEDIISDGEDDEEESSIFSSNDENAEE